MFFFVGLSGSYIPGSRLVELTDVDLDFFVSIFFFKTNDLFFYFHPLTINYWSMSFVIFSLCLWGYLGFRLVKLTCVDFRVFSVFFI